MSQFAFRVTDHGDGTYSIGDVPIFELGEHRGFEYDEAWGDRTISNFAKLKGERGWLPTVFLGHTSDEPGAPEKPAVGFLDNMRRVGKQIVADLTHIGQEIYEQIRAGQWPYRSVEVFNRAAQITGLALLGGTTPYHKFAPLLFGDERGEWVMFQIAEHKDETPMADKPEVVTPDVSAQLAELEAKFEARVASLEKERDEAKAEAKKEADRADTRIATFEEERRRERIERLNDDLRDKFHVATAVIDHPIMGRLIDLASKSDTPVKFKSGDKDVEVEGIDMIRALFADLSKNRKTLFVEIGEAGRVEEGNAPDDGEKRFDQRVDELAKKYVADKVVNTYREAVEKAINELESAEG